MPFYLELREEKIREKGVSDCIASPAYDFALLQQRQETLDATLIDAKFGLFPGEALWQLHTNAARLP